MRHLKDGRKFGRDPTHRKAMFRNLAANLILHERVVTTDAKAKELRRVADRLVTVAKDAGPTLKKEPSKLGSEDRETRLRAYRKLRSFLPWEHFDGEGMNIDVVGKLMDEIAPRYLDRQGGYTRIMKIGNRRGDNAPMSAIEWLPVEEKEKAGKKTEPETVGKKVSRFFKRSKKEEATTDE
jgi:large subunit ribosomal protein L17